MEIKKKKASWADARSVFPWEQRGRDAASYLTEWEAGSGLGLEKKWPDSYCQSVFYIPKYITGLFKVCTNSISMCRCEDLINLKSCVCLTVSM